MFYGVGEATVGRVLVARSGRAVVAILFGVDEADVVRQLWGQFKAARLVRDDDSACQIISSVIRVIEDPMSRPEYGRCDTDMDA